MVQPLWKAIWRFLRKLGMESPFDPAILLHSLCPKYLKSASNSDAVTSMFIATQLTIAKLWNQPRCPSINEWIKKKWYIYTIEYYLALKKNEIMAFAGKWIELENFMLSKISQTPQTKGQMFSLISRY